MEDIFRYLQMHPKISNCSFVRAYNKVEFCSLIPILDVDRFTLQCFVRHGGSKVDDTISAFSIFILSRKVKTLLKMDLYFYHIFWYGLTSDAVKPYLQDGLQMPLL